MSFSQPLIFYFVLLILPLLLGGGLLWLAWQRKRDVSRLGEPQLVAKLFSHLSPRRRGLQLAGLAAGLWLAAFALSGPQLGVKLTEVRRQGRDVLIAVDVSRSMLAEDVQPSRLSRAKQELAALVDTLSGDRVGVLAFAGAAQVVCPLTTDYAAAKMYLNTLEPGLIHRPGTAIGAALRAGAALFPPESAGYRVLVLLTDGEDHEAQLDAAAAEAKAQGVRILAIGVGAAGGEPIPLRGQDGQISGYVKDAKGETVISKLDEAGLRRIAAATNGAYLPAPQGSLSAGQVADLIGQMQKRELSAGQYGAREDRYQYALAPAFLLLLFALWLPLRRKAWLLLIPLLLLSPVAGHASTADDVNAGNRQYQKGKFENALKQYEEAKIKSPQNPVVDYNMGNAYQALQKWEDSQKAYQRSQNTKDRGLKSQAWYNLGNAFFRQQNYPAAAQAYREALKWKPRDADTIYNLAQTLQIMKQPKSQQQQKQQQKQQQQQSQADQKPNPDQKGNASAKPEGQDDRGEAKAGENQEQQTPDEETPQRQLKPGEMSKEDAENLLDAVREEEQDRLREEMKKAPTQGRRKDLPDW